VAGKLSIGAAWSEAAALVRQQRRLLAPVVLSLIMVPTVVTSMMQPQVRPGETPEPGSWMIVALVMVVAMIVGQLAIALLANDWRGSIGEAIGRAARRVPVLILTGLIVILTVMVPLFIAMTIVIALGGIASGDGVELTRSNRLGPAGAIAALLAIAAMIFVMVRLLPLIAVVANRNDGPIAALKHSARLTRGQFWKLLGFVLLMTVAFLIVVAAVSAVLGSLVTLTLGRPEPWSVSLLLIALIGGMIQAAFITIYTVMLTRITVQLEGAEISGT